MYEATFELETLTPLFMRGADQRKAEFRSASVKGAMRWWFRALAGRYFGNNIRNLQKAECRVFGCAGSGETRRSAVVVEVESKSRPKNVFFAPGRFDRDSMISEVKYLFFSLKMTLPKMRNPTFYPPNSKFKVILKSHSLNDLKLAILSLWLAVTFGGFGFRARRGAGSMKITSMKGNSPEVNNFLELLNIETVIKAVKYLENNDGETQNSSEVELRRFLRETFGRDPIEDEGETSYPILRNISVLVKEADSPKDAIKKLEEAYVGSFDRNKWRYVGGVRFEFADYNFSRIVNRWLSKKQTSTKNNIMNEKRFFFGLPLIYANFKSATITAFKRIKTRNGNEKRAQYERRASPVWLSIKEINGKYYAMVTLLPAKFLPDGCKLQLTKFNENLELDLPAETLSSFLKEVRGKFINKGFREVNTVLGTQEVSSDGS